MGTPIRGTWSNTSGAKTSLQAGLSEAAVARPWVPPFDVLSDVPQHGESQAALRGASAGEGLEGSGQRCEVSVSGRKFTGRLVKRENKVGSGRCLGQRGQQHPPEGTESVHVCQCQRGLISEQGGQRHILLGARPPRVTVEQGEDPVHPLRCLDRHRQDGLRDISGLLGQFLGEAWIARSLIASGWPDCTTQPAMPSDDEIRMPVTLSAPSPAAIV